MGDLAVSACRVCGRALGAPFLDLGATPLANEVLPADAEPAAQERFPLAVALCEGCGTAQLLHTVPPARMFSEYVYFSSASDSFLRHAERLAESLRQKYALDATKPVVEMGSNDGYLLQYFARAGVPVLGVDPAANLAALAEAKGVRTLTAFFGPDVVELVRAETGGAQLVLGNNVLAHVPDPVGVLDAARRCLRPGGAAIFEVPYFVELLEKLEFDTIYHEHVFYYSARALSEVGARAGLVLAEVERVPVHGGSLRATFAPRPAEPSASVRALLASEASALEPARLRAFGARVRGLQRTLRALLGDLRAAGRTVGAYGAPAKGNTLLNSAGIGRELVSFTVDRSPAKQGRLLPGSGIPIAAPEALRERRPDYALLLAWNLREEILAQQADYLAAGGKFIIPIPELTVVGAPEDV